MRLRDKVVAVTGASAGIGRAIAIEFARRGARRIALMARGEAGLAGAARDIEHHGATALTIVLDVADADQVESAAERITQELGPIDIWVNDAMVTVFAPVKRMRAEEYRRVTEVTYLGTVHGTMAALKRMLPRDRGTIVQVGSALAYRGVPLQSAYCGAKHAIRGFTDALRAELRHDGSKVHLTMIQLAAFNTPQFDWARAHIERQPQPLPPIFQPEVAARAAVWAATHKRRELYVGFPAVKTIIGNKIAPWLVDRVLASKGYSGQMGDQPLPEGRPDDLFEPVNEDRGAHGRFDDRARPRSWQLLFSMYRAWLAGGVVVALLIWLTLTYWS